MTENDLCVDKGDDMQTWVSASMTASPAVSEKGTLSSVRNKAPEFAPKKQQFCVYVVVLQR